MSNKQTTVVIALLVAILLVLGVNVFDHHERNETIGQKIDEAVEEVQDEIDDHTTSPPP